MCSAEKFELVTVCMSSCKLRKKLNVYMASIIDDNAKTQTRMRSNKFSNILPPIMQCTCCLIYLRAMHSGEDRPPKYSHVHVVGGREAEWRSYYNDTYRRLG